MTMIVKTVALCRNSAGEAEFQFAAIELSEEAYSLGIHYDTITEYAEKEGFEPVLLFDEHENAAKNVAALHQFLNSAATQAAGAPIIKV